MKNGSNKRVLEPAAITSNTQHRRLRVLIGSSLPLTATAFGSKLQKHADLEVIVSSAAAELPDTVRAAEPDVLVVDLEEYPAANGQAPDFLPQLATAVPTVALVTNPAPAWISDTLKAGVLGIVSHTASEIELLAALRAVGAGLVTLSPEFGETFGLPADADEFAFAAESLTAREQEVLVLMAEGLLNKEIADRLRISEHTVKFHISSIMGKLGASSRTEAVTRGIRRGILFI